ncbi:hypothetical protein K490DRAFT_62988 [Saccharata proteae CBS 121410]|uniref:Ribosomal RNA-processing protein 40 n=1 Tax=Saccharata proteae CBS 121410 TaxID=1314787 RepID=A0A9P4HVV7_9PEZI|nr:hypothetical protein K490DRAFT_62988 [Saccharata proteae CBS 121410]
MATEVLLPGEEVPSSLLPTSQNPNKPLTLGPGLRHIPPATITTTVAGSLSVDSKKNAVWIESSSGRYLPTVNDLVIAQVERTSSDMYLCTLSPYTSSATLPYLAFEGATRKTRPQLASGALVYARVTFASKHMEPELECLSQSTGKADGLGPLKGGMLFDVSLGMSRRLLMRGGGVVVLEAMAEKVRFEVAIGRNGRVWVGSDEGVKVVLAVGKALQETDREALGEEGQKKLVQKLLKSL